MEKKEKKRDTRRKFRVQVFDAIRPKMEKRRKDRPILEVVKQFT